MAPETRGERRRTEHVVSLSAVSDHLLVQVWWRFLLLLTVSVLLTVCLNEQLHHVLVAVQSRYVQRCVPLGGIKERRKEARTKHNEGVKLKHITHVEYIQIHFHLLNQIL